jgi:hypothetical protein
MREVLVLADKHRGLRLANVEPPGSKAALLLQRTPTTASTYWIGDRTDDSDLEAEGRTDQAKANLKQAGEKVKDPFNR